jgi:hypothetical protein
MLCASTYRISATIPRWLKNLIFLASIWLCNFLNSSVITFSREGAGYSVVVAQKAQDVFHEKADPCQEFLLFP